jgi:hypothetical protein
MEHSAYFDRLQATVERIARHSYYPGIEQTLDHLLEDLDALRESGMINPAQHDALRLILLGINLQAA